MLTLTTSITGNMAHVSGVALSAQERDLLRWALETIGFVMPTRGTFTGQEWVTEIKAMYDPAQPHIAAAIAAIERAG
jgi:hypothetical protein